MSSQTVHHEGLHRSEHDGVQELEEEVNTNLHP